MKSNNFTNKFQIELWKENSLMISLYVVIYSLFFFLILDKNRVKIKSLVINIILYISFVLNKLNTPLKFRVFI